MNILIGGGTGFVGRHLAKCLSNRGAKIQVISRKENKSKNQISWTTLKQHGLPKDIDSVVNLAGRNIFDPVPWIEPFRKEVYHSRIDTNLALAEAIKSAKVKPKSFITISGVGYYENDPMKVYTEDWKQSGNVAQNNYFMKLADDWEKAAKLNEDMSKVVRQVTIRSGVVLGPDGGMVKNLKPSFLLGLGQTFGDGKQYFPCIHVDDLAGLFEYCITNENITGVINGVSPTDSSKNIDFAEAFAKAMGSSVRLQMPSMIVKFLFGRDRGEVILGGARIKTRAASLGYQFKYPSLDKAMENIVKG